MADPKLQQIADIADSVASRFDAFCERAKMDEDTDEDEDEDVDIDPLDPATTAMRETPGTYFENPDPDEPWFS